jgi:hypothetical protein
MNTKSELKYAQGMIARREVDATRIGRAESRREALALYRSMSACAKEVGKHRANIRSAIDNSNAGLAIEVEALMDKSNEWRSRARLDLSSWGISEQEVAQIDSEVGV